MTHPTDLLPDYLLGLLGEEELARVEAHLATCESCQQALARLGAPLVALTEALPRESPSERTFGALSARFAEAKRAKAARDRTDSSEGAPPAVPVLVDRPEPRLPYVWLTAACLALVVSGASLWWGIRSEARYQQAQAERQQLTDFLAQPNVQKVSLENVFETVGQPSVGSLLVAQERALFVLNSAAPRGSAYQAWGHVSSDWDPDSGETLDSLTVSRSGVFAVDPTGFASLYLSLEPAGGSPQPTNPLAKVSLLAARPDEALVITRPEGGTTVDADRAVVMGELGEGVTDLRYRVNEGPLTEAASANNRFSFTVTGLTPGENTVRVTATSAAGEAVSAAVTLSYDPEQ